MHNVFLNKICFLCDFYLFLKVPYSTKFNNKIIFKSMGQDILEIIRQQRKIKDYSQDYVASELNLSQSHYARIENGKSELMFSVFVKLIEILELEPNFVLQVIYKKPILELNKAEVNLLAFKKEIVEELEKKVKKVK